MTTPAPDREEPRISGAVLLNNFREFEAEIGSDAFRAAIASLPAKTVEQFHALVPVAWMECSVADEIFAAIAKQAGRDLEEMFPAVIERGVTRTLTTVWSPLLRLLSDKAIVTRAPRIFAKSYTRGRLEVTLGPRQDDGTRTAAFDLHDWPGVPKFRLLAVAAGVRAGLNKSGRNVLSIEHARTDDGARFSVTWR